MSCINMLCHKHDCKSSFFMNYITDHLVMKLQPIVSLADRQVKHVEVLIRMKPKKENGQEPLGAELILKRLLAMGDNQCMTLTTIYHIFQLANNFPFSFAINLDADDINQQLVDSINSYKDYFDVNTSKIIFEITERKVVNFATQGNFLVELQGLGFRIALDDFGTGWANLETIEQFDFDLVKIDGRFIRQARVNDRGRKKLQKICEIVRSHDYKIISEYIENEDDLQLALANGVEYVQGYYFSEPVFLAQILETTANINQRSK